MIFEESDRKKLEKLGVKTLLDLSLMLPVGYEDNHLKRYYKVGIDNVVDATIHRVWQTDKYLKLDFFSHNFQKDMTAVIFHPKPFHKKMFTTNKRVYLRGKLEFSFNALSIIQPKIIKEINIIKVKYKNKGLKELVEKYLNISNLLKDGISQKSAKDILLLHYPTVEFLETFQKNGYHRGIIENLKFLEIYNYLKKLSLKKRKYEASCRLDGKIDSFLDSLPFKLTNDQVRCIDDIKKDLSSKYAAKRVIMGDVGCGKTIVMFASVMIAYGKRSLLMVPTTVLAMQIYEEAKRLLPKKIKIVLITSKSKDEDLSCCDFIIGTHALMYKKLPECDLVMIDEQHRFGVNQREFIKSIVTKDKNKRAHFLQFSATPIPRTMALINSSLVDYSFIKELPFKKDITTLIIGREDVKKLLSHIDKEIKQDHQIIIIYPLVEESQTIEYQSIEEAKEYWLKRYKNVYVTFGKDRDKESVLEEFRDKGSILISTTVIEVGISLPRLTTVVVVGAERLGFATLHQIRGRVSRTGLKGYCFLYTNNKNSKRLKEFAKISSGFDIAELDLKFRQSGDILSGKAQSGQSFKWIDLSEDENIIKKAKSLLG